MSCAATTSKTERTRFGAETAGKKSKKNRPVPGGGGTAQGGFDGSDVTLGVKQATDYLCLIQHGNRYSVPDHPSLSAGGFNTAEKPPPTL